MKAPAASAAGAFVGGMGVLEILVRVKLRPPRPLRPLVRRAALEARLGAAVAEAVVVLLLGPAGTGKTSLLTSWLSGAADRPVAWLSVDVGDNDPGRLWAHLVGALAEATGDPSYRTAPEGLPVGSDLYVDALVDRLVDSGHRPVLVLDEYEHLTDPHLHQQLDLLVRGCGDSLTTVIASRVRPPLRLGPLALADRLVVLDWADLRMDEEEAGRLLLDSFGVRSAAAELTALVKSTDGWAGGLALAGALLRTGARPPAGEGLPAGGEALADHLLEYVWAALAPDLREFLLDTAVLERFCVPLADAVHGGGNAAELLDRLRSDGVFIQAEGEADRSWFGYQRLFRWALARRLSASDPERERRAHRAAARWHAAQGEYEAAVGHALRGEEHDLAVGLIDRRFAELLGAGRQMVLEGWLQALPDRAIAAAGAGDFVDRALDLWCTLGRPDERDRWSRAAGRGLPPGGPAKPQDAWQLCLPRERGDLAVALQYGQTVLARAGKDGYPPLTGTQVRISAARSLLLAGRAGEAGRLLGEVDGLWRERAVPAPLAVAVCGLVGLAAFRAGDVAGAREQLARAERARAGCSVPPRPRTVPEYVILRALVAGCDGAPDAFAELRELADCAPGFGPDRSMAAFVALFLAQEAAARRDRAAAAAYLAAADAELASLPSPLGLVDFRHEVAGPSTEGGVPAEPLSEREVAVLQYLRSDLTLHEIAAHLYVSINTVKTHTRHIYRKLGIAGRRQLSLPESPYSPLAST